MSEATAFDDLLRQAIDQAKRAAPRAADDLFRCSSEVAAAVERVTGGSVRLELSDAERPDGPTPTFLLQLFRVGSEAPPTDLGVYALAATGYPVQRWYSRQKWETNAKEPTQLIKNRSEMEHHFRWLISDADSRLVTLVAYFQGVGATSRRPAPPKPPRPKSK